MKQEVGRRTIFRSPSAVLLALAGMVVFLGLALYFSSARKTPVYFVEKTLKFRSALHQKEAIARDLLGGLNAALKSGQYPGTLVSPNLMEEEGIALFAYENDSLAYWSTSGVPLPFLNFDEDFLLDVMKLRNGWYRVMRMRDGPRLLLGFILLKQDYFINNEFLKDRFAPGFDADQSVGLSLDPTDSKFHVTREDGAFLFSLIFDPVQEGNLRYPFAAGLMYLLAILCMLYGLYALRQLRFFRKRPALHLALFVGVVTLLRWANVQFRSPRVLYDLPLFDPEYFASSRWLPSLGDFFLHVLLLTAVLGLIFTSFSKFRFRPGDYRAKPWWVLLFGSIAAAFSYAIHHLMRTLIFDSSISFDLSNILDLSLYSFMGFTLITLLLVDYFIIIHFCSKMLARASGTRFGFAATLTLLPFAGVGALGFLADDLDLPGLLLPYLIYLSVMWLHFRPRIRMDFYAFAPAIVLFSGFATYMLWQLNAVKEKQQRQVLALKIAEEQDHVSEFLFRELARGIAQDRVVRHHLFSYDRTYPYEFFERIAQKYFSGYWSKYALVIMPFSEEELLEYEMNPLEADPDLAMYEQAIAEKGKPTASEFLFFIDNDYGKVNYLARIPVEKRNPNDTIRKFIYLEFISKMVTQVTGFPELLLDREVTRPVNLGGYSYATYKHGQLNLSGGDFNYPLQAKQLNLQNGDLYFFDGQGFNHLANRSGSDKLIVVSKPHPRFLDVLNPFAYLLLYFSALLFLYFVYRYYFYNPGQKIRFSLKGRIQLTILLILLVSLVLVGLGISDYINREFNRKNKATIEEKVNSILSELKSELQGERLSYFPREELNYLLTRYSNIFFSDINLYHADGNLMASSREAIYNEGLISRHMQPDAYRNLVQERQPRFLHGERIGDFEYLSAYAAYRDRSGEVQAYVNLPYFLRQKDLREELSSSLLALINIYSLLIVASMVVSLLIANQLTGPLSILQEKIGQLRLGRKNEIIDYQANDEIGSLVEEYNRMVRELEMSAELLASSERESAWKEMARQVAHEVKNPLTPMKLSVQYLLKAWEDGKPDFDARLRRFRDAMLEQIETLSAIASEFSYFAKLPETRKSEADLREILENVLEFFQTNEEGVLIHRGTMPESAKVLVDRDQMLRVFNNVVRNAIQAIPADREGRVEVRLYRRGRYFWVEIADNGAGIPEEIRDRIFTPNFTTKGSGMGLGLAMTKTIIENMDGDIKFQTETNRGTTFYIRIPGLD